MQKEDVLKLFEKYKDRPFEIDLGDSAACMRGNIDGHWLFLDTNGVIEVKKNTPDGSFNIADTNQPQCPFKVTFTSFENIAYIRSFIKHEVGDIEKQLGNLTPIGTSKSMADILKEIQTDSIHNAASATGFLNTESTAPGTMYGNFRGSVLSTDIGGIPENVANAVLTPKE